MSRSSGRGFQENWASALRTDPVLWKLSGWIGSRKRCERSPFALNMRLAFGPRRPEPTADRPPRGLAAQDAVEVPDQGRPRPESDRTSTTAPDLSPNSAGMWPVITLSEERVAASGLTPK